MMTCEEHMPTITT